MRVDIQFVADVHDGSGLEGHFDRHIDLAVEVRTQS